MIAEFDAMVGKYVDTVKAAGVWEQTVTIVTSDHGFNLGHHRIPTAKMTMYEHSLRIPQLFMGPGIRRNSTFDFLGTQVDLAPTILGMAGIDTPPYMDGRSVLPLLASARAAEEQDERLPGSVARHLRRYFDLHGTQLPPPGLYARILKELELPLIEIALDATSGNQAKCADLLGINRNTLRKKITDLDIRVTRRRKLM